MSLANQPTRLLISSDDLEYGSPGSFSITLPEPVTGATRVDMARASIPTSQYPIPDYQNKFYFRFSTTPAVLRTLTLTNSRYFGNIPDLILQLNADATAQGLAITFTYNSTTTRIGVTSSDGVTTIKVEPRATWPTRFSLNTRLGFQDPGSPAWALIQPATILPNLIRTKVIYVLCDVVLNNTISTDGLRTAIAKVPVNSVYGGITIYSPPELSYCRVAHQAYKDITITLLDDNYQVYPLALEEFSEFELVFKYE